jgi:hypothetical protein
MRTTTLFSLIAMGLFHSVSFGQDAEHFVCDDDFYCRTFGPGMPFVGSNDGSDRAPEKTAFTAFTSQQPPVDDEAQPPRDPLILDQPQEMQHAEPHAPKAHPFPATTPSVLAERSVGIGFLIAGAAGWGLLTIAFLILVARQRPAPKS